MFFPGDEVILKGRVEATYAGVVQVVILKEGKETEVNIVVDDECCRLIVDSVK